jgi:hypothetical protein
VPMSHFSRRDEVVISLGIVKRRLHVLSVESVVHGDGVLQICFSLFVHLHTQKSGQSLPEPLPYPETQQLFVSCNWQKSNLPRLEFRKRRLGRCLGPSVAKLAPRVESMEKTVLPTTFLPGGVETKRNLLISRVSKRTKVFNPALNLRVRRWRLYRETATSLGCRMMCIIWKRCSKRTATNPIFYLASRGQHVFGKKVDVEV